MASEGLNALRGVSRLSVEVSDLLRNPGSSKHLEFDEEVADLALPMGRAGSSLSFDLRLESLLEGILVRGTVRGTYVLECIRCLVEFRSPFALDLAEVLAYPDQPAPEEGYRITGDHADLEPVIRDLVLLAMPPNPLHAPGCRGLCAACGADRNAIDCGHDAGPGVDARWRPLERPRERLDGPGD